MRSVESTGGNRLGSLAAMIIAVLAALGTLFSHHRSISALPAKYQAILSQTRATDTYNAYEAKQIHYNIYQALIATDLIRTTEVHARLNSVAEKERSSTPAALAKAQALERQATSDHVHSEKIR